MMRGEGKIQPAPSTQDQSAALQSIQPQTLDAKA